MEGYEIASRSILGSRDEQQDSYAVAENGDSLLAVVCDGMGGHSGGALASQLAVKMLTESYLTGSVENIPAFFITQAEQLNRAVYGIRDENGSRIGCGSTIAAAAVRDNGLYWLSIGDSRLYLYRSGVLTQITEDHNYRLKLDEMLSSGEIDLSGYESELSRAEALISCLGMKKLGRVNMNIDPLRLLSGDVLLLMSDGLYKAAGDNEILERIGGSAEETAAGLERLVLESGRSLDNTTFIIITNGGI